MIAGFDLPDNGQRIFRPGIVGGYDNEIAVLAGDPTHRPSFCLIAIAAAAENRYYLALG